MKLFGLALLAFSLTHDVLAATSCGALDDLKQVLGVGEATDACRCEQRNDYFRALFKNPISLTALARDPKIQASQIVLLGENHYDFGVRSAEYELVQELSRNGGFDCLILESESKHQNDLDRYLQGKSTYIELRDAYLPLEGWIRAIMIAHEANLPVFSVDDVSVQASNGKMRLNLRNQAMAKNIDALFRSRSCTRAIALNGKSHLAQSNGLHRMLRDLGYSAATVNIKSNKKMDDPDDELNWGICKSNPKVSLSKPVAFSRVAWPRRIPFQHPSHLQADSWNEFDFNLFVPEVSYEVFDARFPIPERDAYIDSYKTAR